MPDYKQLYYRLFNRVSNIILSLQTAQLECEAIYMDASDTEGGPEREETAAP